MAVTSQWRNDRQRDIGYVTRIGTPAESALCFARCDVSLSCILVG